jgi:hypothetical protein
MTEKKSEVVVKATDNIFTSLMKIQQNLKAPKGQYNEFAKFKYRSCEDILEAVKPLLDTSLYLLISDEIVLIGERYYVKATVKLSNGKDEINVSAFARESLDKKGMDDAQITGATSSYARKYALNGMFAIDDTKDADTQKNEPQKVQAKNIVSGAEMKAIGKLLETILNAKDIEALEKIGGGIKKLIEDKKITANQKKILQESYASKLQKLQPKVKTVVAGEEKQEEKK